MSEMVIPKWRVFDMLGYEVHHPEVRRFHESSARVKVCVAPRRTTKSYGAAKDVIPDLLKPNTRGWVVGPNYQLAEKEFRYIHDDIVVKLTKMGLPRPKICSTGARSGGLYIRWPWGSVLEGKTADRPDSLLGEAVNFVIYSEAAQLPRGIRERYVEPTLITTKGREIIPTTPDSSARWVYELFQNGKSDDKKYADIESFTWDITANPIYDREDFEKKKAFYGENHPVFREQYLGEWVHYSGLIYPMFNADTHIIEPFEIPAGWPKYRVIDPGGRDPFVVLWFAVGPKGEVYFYREYYERELKGIKEHAANIRGFSRERIRDTYYDPSATQVAEDLMLEGITCNPANNERMAGRLRVTEYLTPTAEGHPPYPMQGKPREKEKYPHVYFFSTMRETFEEIAFFRWRDENMKKQDHLEGEKERTQGDDHAMDCLRYALMTRPSPSNIVKRTVPGSFDWYRKQITSRRRKGAFIGV